MSRIAVIIVNYNGGELLQQCLDALAAQTVAAARVLVVDNGSRDGSIEACRARHPSVEYHLLASNAGFARANNVGIGIASDCEWVGLLNPDAFPERGWIEALGRGIRDFPEAVSFASHMRWATDPRIADGAGDAYRVDGLAWPRFQGAPVTHLPPAPVEVFSPSAGAALYRRDAVCAVGGFCERFFCYYEDVDLGFRLRLNGGSCRYLPDAVVNHLGSAITGKGSEFSVYHVHRNFVWTYVRNMPGLYAWIYLPAHLAANLASVILFVRKGQGRAILRAKRDAVLGLPQAIAERWRIQAARRASGASVVAVMERGNLLTSIYRRVTRPLRQALAR